MDKIMDLLGPILALLGQGDQAVQNLFSNDENIKRYFQGQDEIRSLRDRGQSRLDTAAGESARMTAGMEDFGRQFWRDQGTSMRGILEGSGDQERKDINEGYAAEQGGALNDLTSRGLAGTTITPNVRQGIERERTGAQGRLNQRLRQERLGLESYLAGNTYGSEMTGRQRTLDQFNANIGNRTNYDLNTTGMLTNWIGDRQDVGPNEQNFIGSQSSLGAGQAPAGEFPVKSTFFGIG